MCSDTPPLIDLDTEMSSSIHAAGASSHPSLISPLLDFPPSISVDRHTSPPARSPQSMEGLLRLATQSLIANQKLIDRTLSKLDRAEAILQQLTDKLHPAVILNEPDDHLMISAERGESYARGTPTEMRHGQLSAIFTSAIAHAKEREASPYSSGPSRPSDTARSTERQPLPSFSSFSVPSAGPRPQPTVVNATAVYPAVTPQTEVSSILPELQSNPSLSLLPTKRGMFGRKALVTSSYASESLPEPDAPPPKRARGRPRKSEQARRTPSSTNPPPRTRSQSSLALTTLRADSPADSNPSSSGPRRSSRAQPRPDNYFGFADPSHPSYIPLFSESARTRRQTDIQLKAAEAVIQLLPSDGKVRAKEADWPELPEKNLAGITIALVCDMCTGRCHLACAGLSVEECSFHDWTCPDCMQIAIAGEPRLFVQPSDHVKCIRQDCILRPALPGDKKQKPKAVIGDDYRLDRILGRKRAPDWTPSNRKYEYLLLWAGIDPLTDRSWSLEDATWEPRANIFTIVVEEAVFAHACREEGLVLTDGPKPVLLQEALSAWDEDGELKGDGWSKRQMAALAARASSSKKRKISA